MAPALPRVAIIGTGGTISTVSRHPLDLFDYGSHGRILEIDELIDRIPQIAEGLRRPQDIVASSFPKSRSCVRRSTADFRVGGQDDDAIERSNRPRQ